MITEKDIKQAAENLSYVRKNPFFDNGSLAVLCILIVPGFGLAILGSIVKNRPTLPAHFWNNSDFLLWFGFFWVAVAAVSFGTLLARITRKKK